MDWYSGHSWASGTGLVVPNGRNQESSSEAIAAYEAVAIYGQVMQEVWGESGTNEEKVRVAKEVETTGKVMLTTELRSAKKYWHVEHNDAVQPVYPEAYTPYVVGILWQSMAQFSTWFGNSPYLMYGIQLLPLTSVGESRDSIEWVKAMYPTFSESCQADILCSRSGWGVLEAAMLATAGQQESAARKALALPPDAFLDAGGSGHSLTNTLWYIATRPVLEEALPDDGNESSHPPQQHELKDCGVSDTCTSEVLGLDANGHTCGERIEWLISVQAMSEEQACSVISTVEYPEFCGPCNPLATQDSNSDETSEEDQNDETAPAPAGSRIPAPSEETPFDTGTWKPIGNDCPSCPEAICKSDLNRCPIGGTAPFLCTKGLSIGGCSSTPWSTNSKQCAECCEVFEGCSHL